MNAITVPSSIKAALEGLDRGDLDAVRRLLKQALTIPVPAKKTSKTKAASSGKALAELLGASAYANDISGHQFGNVFVHESSYFAQFTACPGCDVVLGHGPHMMIEVSYDPPSQGGFGRILKLYHRPCAETYYDRMWQWLDAKAALRVVPVDVRGLEYCDCGHAAGKHNETDQGLLGCKLCDCTHFQTDMDKRGAPDNAECVGCGHLAGIHDDEDRCQFTYDAEGDEAPEPCECESPGYEDVEDENTKGNGLDHGDEDPEPTPLTDDNPPPACPPCERGDHGDCLGDDDDCVCPICRLEAAA